MSHFHFILAFDAGMVKFAIFVIFLILWGISALASSVKKAAEQAKRRSASRPISVPPQIPAPVRPPPLSHRRPAQQKRAPQQQRAPLLSRPVPGGFVPPVNRPAAPMPAPVPPPQRNPVSALTAAPAPATGARVAPAPAAVKLVPHGASPSAIRRWLRPASLRKQFILTELLQPPIALRPPREN